MAPASIEELQQKLAITEEALRLSEERGTAGQLALEPMHEVKNPLETLGHLTYLALAEPDSEAVRVYLHQADEQVRMMGQIASQTLGFARESSAPQIVQVLPILEAAVRIHQRAIDRKKIQVVTDGSGQYEVNVYPGQILQVLSNLIGNAVDASGSEGHLHIIIRKRKKHVEIVIADNGTGIAADNLALVFEPFFSTKGSRGTGLGLSLSRKIIERHRGQIRMHSRCREFKAGTVFRVSLPCADRPG
ncbi:sensor histidine kinase [Granulicella arctica]|uniref:sensor histidine kinase n=1 Tax=Granulicella arctica TaxID=940613 RepID=UPI0021DF81EE|nr:ATP-binding protein [Granulicella arctica]